MHACNMKRSKIILQHHLFSQTSIHSMEQIFNGTLILLVQGSIEILFLSMNQSLLIIKGSIIVPFILSHEYQTHTTNF